MNASHAIGCDCVFCLQVEASRVKEAEHTASIKRIVTELENKLQCVCDLDNWEPEPLYGHSWVCPIYKVARDKEKMLTTGGKS